MKLMYPFQLSLILQYVIYPFSLAALKIFISGCRRFDHNMFWFTFLHVSIAWRLFKECFVLAVYSFHQIWKMVDVISSSIFFCTISFVAPFVSVLGFLKLSQS